MTTELQPGWNLAGWTEDEAAVSELFEAIPQLDAVYTWDAFRHRFLGAFREGFGAANSLMTLTPGMGLVLYLGGTEAVEWTRPLNPRSGATTLRPGWNLVTWAGADEVAPDQALEVLGAIVVEAKGIDGSALPTLNTGSAFWLHVSALKEWWQLDTRRSPSLVLQCRSTGGVRLRGKLTVWSPTSGATWGWVYRTCAFASDTTTRRAAST